VILCTQFNPPLLSSTKPTGKEKKSTSEAFLLLLGLAAAGNINSRLF